MTLKVQLDVKFRAFFITFANWHEEWTIALPLPVPLPIPVPVHLDYSRNGVRLRIDSVTG